ncbi:MAG TPA: hypothetical protein VK041_08090 [Opitutales bacterium]|nr:hypothetical protein [Opitutales bacterium]
MKENPEKLKNWRTVFSRVRDDSNGLPRFYVRESRAHLFEYNGYEHRHEMLNRILKFFGENRARWKVFDSPMNVSSYSLYQIYDPDNVGSKEYFVVQGGNYIYGEPQGAWVGGFRLFRDLVDYLDLRQPRRLKGEKK